MEEEMDVNLPNNFEPRDLTENGGILMMVERCLNMNCGVSSTLKNILIEFLMIEYTGLF